MSDRCGLPVPGAKQMLDDIAGASEHTDIPEVLNCTAVYEEERVNELLDLTEEEAVRLGRSQHHRNGARLREEDMVLRVDTLWSPEDDRVSSLNSPWTPAMPAAVSSSSCSMAAVNS